VDLPGPTESPVAHLSRHGSALVAAVESRVESSKAHLLWLRSAFVAAVESRVGSSKAHLPWLRSTFVAAVESRVELSKADLLWLRSAFVAVVIALVGHASRQSMTIPPACCTKIYDTEWACASMVPVGPNNSAVHLSSVSRTRYIIASFALYQMF
jgi:hypothetical protein